MGKFLCTVLFFSIAIFSAGAQKNYAPFFKKEKIVPVVSNFDSTAVVWPASTGNVIFKKDSLPSNLLRVWQIRSADYNEEIYAVYTDTINSAVINWADEKNYIMNVEKYGAGKALFFFFPDGTPVKKTDINTLRRTNDIPGLRD